MKKVYELEELEQVTSFLADMPLSNSPHQVIIDTLSYAVHLINQLQEDPLYAIYTERLNDCITQLSDNPDKHGILSTVVPVAIKTLKHYNKSVSKKLRGNKSFFQQINFWI